jgi:hypothetical protein
MPPLNDGVMHDMITSGSMATATNPGFFTQEEARATEAIEAASRGGDDGIGDAMQDVNKEEEEHAQVDEEDEQPEPTSMTKGQKKRKKTLSTTEPRVKWMGKEEECLAEAWKTVSMTASSFPSTTSTLVDETTPLEEAQEGTADEPVLV